MSIGNDIVRIVHEGILSMSQSFATSSPQQINNVTAIEDTLKQMPQEDIVTSHTLHGGVYTRTIKISAGVMITGALVKIDTTLIIAGKVVVYDGGMARLYDGYSVIPAQAHRKGAFHALEDTMLTMIFKTDATTVEEAEREFTDQHDELISRKSHSINHIGKLL